MAENALSVISFLLYKILTTSCHSSLYILQLKDWKYSTIYLGTFCIASTLCMGCFATVYGTCSRKLGKDRGRRGEFIMECISASLSIIVGILWLVLLACGKLEDVFP
jgi:hypothetical protein